MEAHRGWSASAMQLYAAPHDEVKDERLNSASLGDSGKRA